jgi:hypothetical protein
MLDKAIEDRQKRYYLVIDKLDEKWVEDDLRYKLIKALIETVKDFGQVQQVKTLVVLRIDLIDRVYNATRDTGFQEEKFTSLYLRVRWNRTQLTELLDRRIDYLVKQRYTTKRVSHEDILPDSIAGQSAIDYILDRTLMRPRDVIQFFNYCIQEAENSPIVDEEMLIKAEREYSRDRFESITNEWHADYPHLESWVKLLGNQSQFFQEDISQEQLETTCLEYTDKYETGASAETDKLYALAAKFITEQDIAETRKELIVDLYSVGILGIQLEDTDTPIWSYEQRRNLSVDELTSEVILHIHPCFWSHLHIKN